MTAMTMDDPKLNRKLTRLRADVERAERTLEAAKRARSAGALEAVDAGMPQTHVARELGFSRETLRQVLNVERARRGS